MFKDFIVKNMVCDRCIMVLKNELENHNIELLKIELGHVRLDIKNDDQINEFETILDKNGFALICSEEEVITEKIKVILIKTLQELPLHFSKNISSYLAEKLGYGYSRISKVFSITEGITIEKYFIRLKIERVKELIQTNEYNFTEISQLLDYSHINHLSAQFKRETGMSLSKYKSQQKNFRNPLDKVI